MAEYGQQLFGGGGGLRAGFAQVGGQRRDEQPGGPQSVKFLGGKHGGGTGGGGLGKQASGQGPDGRG